MLLTLATLLHLAALPIISALPNPAPASPNISPLGPVLPDILTREALTSFLESRADNIAVSSDVAAVSRKQGTMELWWVMPNGAVHDAYWYDGSGWKDFQLAPPGSAATGGGIAAISRVPDSMDVFWVTPNGAVFHASWAAGSAGWNNVQLASQGSASPGTLISAISRNQYTIELWWVTPNGAVTEAYRSD